MHRTRSCAPAQGCAQSDPAQCAGGCAKGVRNTYTTYRVMRTPLMRGYAVVVVR